MPENMKFYEQILPSTVSKELRVSHWMIQLFFSKSV